MHIRVDKLWALDYHAWIAAECMNEQVFGFDALYSYISFQTNNKDNTE
jgi:hypothetical protein